jgi:hypothetical protein
MTTLVSHRGPDIIGRAQGPRGAPGIGGEGFLFEQASPSDTWIINHNLGFRPDVTLLTTGGVEMIGSVVHTSVNQAVAQFSSAVAGSARCI